MTIICKILFRILAVVSVVSFLTGCSGNWQDYLTILENVQRNLEPVWNLLVTLSYVLGLFFMATAIFKLKAYGQQTVMMSTHASMGPALAYMLVGAGLLALPKLVDTMLMTIWGYNYDNILAYQPSGGGYDDILGPIFALVQVLGLISVLRGWIMLTKLGQQGQPGTLAKAIMHMIGGIAAINIHGSIGLLQATLFNK